MKNLTFSNVPSYYGLDEKYSYSGLFKWSNPKLKDVIALTGREKAANGICLIQFFPYHSTTYSPLNRILPSQKYSFHLVQSAIEQGKLIVIMRSRRNWEEQVPELREYPYIELKAPRSPYLTQNNMT
jgi:hypothetical protein